MGEDDLVAATSSAVIAAIPEIEPVVAPHRRRLDRSAAWGVPAHVTVLYPFLAPAELDADAVAALGAAVRTVDCFDLKLRRLERFGEEVLWLAPEPDAAFRTLTNAVWKRFPTCPPYGGAHDELVPRLTVGHDHCVDQLRAAAEMISPALPITDRVESVQLICGSPEPDSWSTLTVLPLGV